jgi:hypothetical protein
VPLVLDLRITHDRVGSSTDPTLNGHLRYRNKLDQSLHDSSADKIRKYRTDYNNNPPNIVSFIPVIPSTSGRLHSEFVRIFFLQVHRQTDLFFASSGVQLAQSTSGFFHFRRAAFFTNLKSKIGKLLGKAAVLRINLNLDGVPIPSKSHTHPSHSQTFSFVNLVFIFRCYSSTTNPVYERRVNLLVLVCSLSSHRHSYIGFIFSSRFIDS